MQSRLLKSIQPAWLERGRFRERTQTVLSWTIKIRDRLRARGYEAWTKERKLNLTAIAPVNQINKGIIEFPLLTCIIHPTLSFISFLFFPPHRLYCKGQIVVDLRTWWELIFLLSTGFSPEAYNSSGMKAKSFDFLCTYLSFILPLNLDCITMSHDKTNHSSLRWSSSTYCSEK